MNVSGSSGSLVLGRQLGEGVVHGVTEAGGGIADVLLDSGVPDCRLQTVESRFDTVDGSVERGPRIRASRGLRVEWVK